MITSGIRHVLDRHPGIRRLRRGRGFIYLTPNGKRLSAKGSDILRIRSLVIPPAWTDVWISPLPEAHLQATGRDARGRKQYRYHHIWRARKDSQKFDRMPHFARALPRIRARMKRDLRLPGMTRHRILAAIIRLLDTTLIRIGNTQYARDNHSYGLTTLRNRHVAVKGSQICFSFRGKSGQRHDIRIDDARIARIVRRCQELPGQALLEYVDEDGGIHAVGSEDVNEYLREAAGGDFTAKDFRTWHATSLTVAAMGRATAAGKKPTASETVAVIKEVAEALGNTPAVCKSSYIHPQVFETWKRGRPFPPPLEGPRGLNVAERQALALLQPKKGATARPSRKGEAPRVKRILPANSLT